MLKLCYDTLALRNVGYPNLASGQARPYTNEWYQFDNQYPRVVPLRLLLYTQDYSVSTSEHLSTKAWYPIGLGWFDFEFDYFSAIPCLDRVRQKLLKVLFYYHEGDNPFRIKERLDTLVSRNNLPHDCYIFISANTQASKIKNFIYFPDHEFFFRYINRNQVNTDLVHELKHDFTVLSRLPKWWRASIISDLFSNQLLASSLLSYNTANETIDNEADNPIELDIVPGWRENARWITYCKFKCDNLSHNDHNNHGVVNTYLYTATKCSIVLETHFDVDQSNGAFLTEKTFKPIKFGQPFVVAGGPGSLQALRDSGYRVFDGIIDNEYDTILDNTKRYLALRGSLIKIQANKQFYQECLSDVLHNQKIFNDRATAPVNNLLKELECLLQ